MEDMEDHPSRSPDGLGTDHITLLPSGDSRTTLLEKWSFLLLILAALAVWEITAHAGWISTLFFPAPSTIAAGFLTMTSSGELAANLGATLYRFGLGLATGGTAGFLMGIALGLSPRLRRILDPLVSGLYAMPKLALFPLFLILFGLGDTSRIVLIALAAFFPLLINTIAGVRQINPDYFEIARSYGTSPALLLRSVVIPGSLPSVLSGLRLAVGTTLMITIAVELINAKLGLGAIIWTSWQTLRTENLYVALFTAGALGIGSHLLLEYLSRLLAPWQAEHGKEISTKAIPEI
jgi:ABC-type nitrate/sulfonate/bicarbonate transport system permease component